MGKKLDIKAAVSDPVQKALLKAAARKERYSKENPESTEEGRASVKHFGDRYQHFQTHSISPSVPILSILPL